MDSSGSQHTSGSSGAIGPVQPTFDLPGLSKDLTILLTRLLAKYADDNLPPISRLPLERFGSFVAVDSRRITEGQGVLTKTKSVFLNFLKIVVGLSGRGIASDVADNASLTGAFQFAAACSATLKPDEAGALIYEIILLSSAANDRRLAPPSAVKQFVRSLYGYVDLMETSPEQHTKFGDEENPRNLYTKLSEAAVAHLHRQPWPDLWLRLEMKTLAEILYKVFEGLLDTDNELITLEGSHSGLLVATVFWWLRKEETTISIRGDRILPVEGERRPRLSINLNRIQGGVSRWTIQRWHAVTSPVPKEEEKLGDSGDLGYMLGRPHSHYPIHSARSHMLSSGVSGTEVEEIGRLAAALIDAAIEQGTIYDSLQRKIAMKEIVSSTFLNSYRVIMQKFGWEALRREPLDPMVEALTQTFAKFQEQNPYHEATDAVEALGCALQDCEKRYHQSTEEHFVSRGMAFNDVAERAIHLATEALYFSLCLKFPDSAVYRPLTANRLGRNAAILRQLISSDKGLSYWTLRNESIQAILEGVADAGAEDLIISGNGYSVCAAALADLQKDPTNKRVASSFSVLPGPLRMDQETSCFERLVWKQGPDLSFSRLRVNEPISLFESGRFCGLGEEKAYQNLDVKIKHMVGANHDNTSKDVLYLTTYVHRGSEFVTLPGVRETLFAPPVPTDWAKSIEAILFSRHVSQYDLSPSQERILAEEWRDLMWLDALEWVWPGQIATSRGGWLSRTSGNAQLRFFEAGYLAEGRRRLIRQQSVPLMQCLKEAFATYQGNRQWAILS